MRLLTLCDIVKNEPPVVMRHLVSGALSLETTQATFLLLLPCGQE